MHFHLSIYLFYLFIFLIFFIFIFFNIFYLFYLFYFLFIFFNFILFIFIYYYFFLQGYAPEIFYPKRTDKPIYKILTAQCTKLHIPFVEQLPTPQEIDTGYAVVLDAIFGFSFKGNLRPPFDTIIDTLKLCKSPICSVDIPSGMIHIRGE